MGVSPGETIQSNDEILVLFLTTDELKEDGTAASSTTDVELITLSERLSRRVFRSNSFDITILQNELRQKKDEFKLKFCNIL